jgi:hypothetical protein
MKCTRCYTNMHHDQNIEGVTRMICHSCGEQKLYPGILYDEFKEYLEYIQQFGEVINVEPDGNGDLRVTFTSVTPVDYISVNVQIANTDIAVR